MKTNSLSRFLNPNYGYYYQPQQNMQHKNNEHLKHVKCPKCSHNFKLNILDNLYKYICTHCKYEMKFSEYQKRYNNINWLKISKKGIPLYSWKDNCPNCKNLVLSFIKQKSFGLEYIIKEKEISNLGLDPEDINKLLINLERY